MGIWNTGILDNDAAMDVYGFFEKLYNKQELDIEAIKQKTLSNFGLVNENKEPLYENEGWLAYAMICWECKALDEQTINMVKEILNNKENIEKDWQDLAEKRIKEIKKFAAKIEIPPKQKKKIEKEYIVHVPFQEGDCVVIKCENKMYSAVVLLDIDKKQPDEPNTWVYFFSTTRIYSRTKPTLVDIKNSHFLVVNYGRTFEGESAKWIEKPSLWINGNFIGSVKSEKEKQEIEAQINQYEIIGKINFKTKPEYKLSYGTFELDNSFQLRSQIEWEKDSLGHIDLSHPIKKYID